MGSGASKATRTASRKFPTKAQIPSASRAPPTHSAAPDHRGPTVHPQKYASGSKDAAVTQDSLDPDLALNERLARIGPVQPAPTFSNSSTFNNAFQPSTSTPSQSIFPSPASNPAVTLLQARERLAAEAERELEDVARLGKGRTGRRFLDVDTIRRVLVLRDEQGKSEAEIEQLFQLERGLVKNLGRQGVVGRAS